MATMQIEVPENAEAIFEAANGLDLKAYIEKHAARWVNGAEQELIVKEAEINRGDIIASAISRRSAEKEAIAAEAAKGDQG